MATIVHVFPPWDEARNMPYPYIEHEQTFDG